jgi:hypothetical protein
MSRQIGEIPTRTFNPGDVIFRLREREQTSLEIQADGTVSFGATRTSSRWP